MAETQNRRARVRVLIDAYGEKPLWMLEMFLTRPSNDRRRKVKGKKRQWVK